MIISAILFCSSLTPIMSRPSTQQGNFLECGRTYISQPRIFNGVDSAFGQQPWQVALLRSSESSPDVQRYFCGGVLINERYVVTAAHCVTRLDTSGLVARVGEHTLDERAELYEHEDHSVRKKIVHEAYVAMYNQNDIALLELTKPVVFRRHVAPICLPEGDANFEGRVATVSGWGITNFSQQFMTPSLREVEIQIADLDICRAWFAANATDRKFSETWLCGGFEKSGRSPCVGDSGTGLFLRTNGRAELVGLVSGGFKCGGSFIPHMYTSVSSFVDWINTNMDLNEVDH